MEHLEGCFSTSFFADRWRLLHRWLQIWHLACICPVSGTPCKSGEPVRGCDRGRLPKCPKGPSAASAKRKSQKQQFSPFRIWPDTASRFPESRSEYTIVALRMGARKLRPRWHGLFLVKARNLWTLSSGFLKDQMLYFYLFLLNLLSLIILFLFWQWIVIYQIIFCHFLYFLLIILQFLYKNYNQIFIY